MLLEEVGKGLIGQLLEALHAILGEQIKCVPSLVIELNAFARHAGLSGRIFAALWHFPQLRRSR
jgi:hypothetical protein